MNQRDESSHPPLQPLLHDSTVLLRAPSQAWSAADGEMGSAPIHGFYHGDRRVLAGLSVRVGGSLPEAISGARDGASSARFVALVRALDDASADPKLRLVRSRTIEAGVLRESLTLESALPTPVDTVVEVRLVPDDSVMHVVKAGLAEPSGGWAAGVTLSAPGAAVRDAVLTWPIALEPRGSATVEWSLAVTDPAAVVAAAPGPAEWAGAFARADDSRLAAWLSVALDDLDALRMVTTARPDQPFLAAGAPWFFTLFGRDSIWAARMLLPLGTGIAGSTLGVLAGLQGTRDVADTAEQPGKIMHELRATTLEIPGEGVSLPPLYYGTVDATALWVLLLHDAWRWGLPDAEVEELLPALEAALGWLVSASDADGFLRYVDSTGHGLANQGWKDSGDSIQWHDGRLAEGPIALCEVQAYAHEAFVNGAAVLERFGRNGSAWLRHASDLKTAFDRAFWIDTSDGGYPAIALDAHGRAVDSVTSNLGHLLGTGILAPERAGRIAELLVSPALNSGYGLRTLSTDDAGYAPLSYHGGSVWAHDTAVAVAGLAREGFGAESAELARGLLAAAEGFGYRMPELHSGDSASVFAAPVPYPAACRPQAWSAGAAVVVLSTALGLAPAGDTLTVAPNPAVAGAVSAHGIRYRGVPVPIP